MIIASIFVTLCGLKSRHACYISCPVKNISRLVLGLLGGLWGQVWLLSQASANLTRSLGANQFWRLRVSPTKGKRCLLCPPVLLPLLGQDLGSSRRLQSQGQH